MRFSIRLSRFAPLVLGVAVAAVAGVAFACGLEDPSSIAARRGMLNMAYPASLHVGTAVWQAQLAGRPPRAVGSPMLRRADRDTLRGRRIADPRR